MDEELGPSSLSPASPSLLPSLLGGDFTEDWEVTVSLRTLCTDLLRNKGTLRFTEDPELLVLFFKIKCFL